MCGLLLTMWTNNLYVAMKLGGGLKLGMTSCAPGHAQRKRPALRLQTQWVVGKCGMSWATKLSNTPRQTWLLFPAAKFTALDSTVCHMHAVLFTATDSLRKYASETLSDDGLVVVSLYDSLPLDYSCSN